MVTTRYQFYQKQWGLWSGFKNRRYFLDVQG